MLWMVLFIAWIITLWFLSSHAIPVTEEAPKILNIDKVAHFGYFFGGGYILATWSQLKYDDQSSLFTRYFFPIIFLSIYGAIDEYHQTFTPGRSGNDLYDWIADFLGASFGVLLANYFHRILFKFSSPFAPEPEV